MNFWKWFLYLIALAGFIWFVFFRPVGKNVGAKAQTEVNTIPEESSAEYVPERTIDDEVVNENTPENSSNTNESASETTTSESEIKNEGINLKSKYLIVVGSFGSKSNANRMLKRVENSGKEGVITNIRGLHRVVAASSDDESDAKNLRRHFTDVYKEQAFILEQ